MDTPDSEAMRREILALADRAGPILGEFCDAFALVGLRAGGGPGLHLTVVHTAEEEQAIENVILELAAQIVVRRGVRSAGE